ncbi:hypothetical protein J3458_008687 [Metarhizium acridum]|uniref:uncharacterized protein n=1 Tax=Metarhizium acridum TaxID=92637 RepID=UPI001C6B56CC|nr:hypothetical protein J3458_008687 [Metarhizium acridum]
MGEEWWVVCLGLRPEAAEPPFLKSSASTEQAHQKGQQLIKVTHKEKAPRRAQACCQTSKHSSGGDILGNTDEQTRKRLLAFGARGTQRLDSIHGVMSVGANGAVGV